MVARQRRAQPPVERDVHGFAATFTHEERRHRRRLREFPVRDAGTEAFVRPLRGAVWAVHGGGRMGCGIR